MRYTYIEDDLMILKYKYKWNKKNTKLSQIDKINNGAVYKELICNDYEYIIIKYNLHKTTKYIVKKWRGGYYHTLWEFNNPRESINYIIENSKQLVFNAI